MDPLQLPVETSAFEADECTRDLVEIPTLPRGRILRLELLSTWGDPYYIGLHGIEVFDESGLEITPVSIAATPPSINVLPDYDADPRTADKLIDGVSCTCDELHAWLAPYEMGREHSITLQLADAADPAPALSMLRIWNYNKSRAHSYRGARHVRASVDGTPVFDGEIRKAPGALEAAASGSEMILFTVSEEILSKIEDNDTALASEDDANLLREAHQLLRARPKTAEAGEDMLQRIALDASTVSYSEMLAEEGLVREVVRPRTAVLKPILEEAKQWSEDDGTGRTEHSEGEREVCHRAPITSFEDNVRMQNMKLLTVEKCGKRLTTFHRSDF